jgi:hypothetical protein
MDISLAQTQKILTGNYTFNQLGFSLLITRCKRIYISDTTKLQACGDEINAFLKKYAIIMSEDYATISRL